MENQESNERIKKVGIALVVILLVMFAGFMVSKKLSEKKEGGGTITPTPSAPTPTPDDSNVVNTGSFNIDIIRRVNALGSNTNYLVSPYNIEAALRLLNEGTAGNTRAEIEKVIGTRTMTDVSIPGILNIANGLFVKNQYKGNVKNDFTNVLTNKYKSEIIYDDFRTPDKINNWANEKTKGMIKRVLDDINEDFILGVASALALDIKWQDSFDCNATQEQEFTKADNSKMKTEMMHQTYESNAKYIKTDDAVGIVIPYKNDVNDVLLEFVAILPNGNVNDYVNNLTQDKIDALLKTERSAGSKLHINLSIPRFTYGYSIDDLAEVLRKLGIVDVFNPAKADLSNMLDIQAYVSTAVHKTYVELSETGTKAAAITYFGVDKSAVELEEYETVNVTLNKPFVYMIRERNHGELLFFGTVFEPNTWKGSTCTSK